MMKKILVLLIMILFISGCGNEKITDKDSVKAIDLGHFLYMVTYRGDKKSDDTDLIQITNLVKAAEMSITDKIGEEVEFKIINEKESFPTQAEVKDYKIISDLASGYKISFQTVSDLKKILKDQVVLVDVRTKEEYDSGHINEAKLVPLNEINNNFNEEKNKIIVVYCRSGNRSSQAQSILESKGYLVFDAGGINSYNNELE